MTRILNKIFFIFSIFLFLYTFYRSEIHWGGSNRNYYLNYYFLSFLCISISLIFFYLRESIKIYFFITLFSFIFSLYVFEIFLSKGGLNQNKLNSHKKNTQKIQIYKKTTNKDYDTRSRFQIYEDFLKLDPHTALTIGRENYLTYNSENSNSNLFPLGGKSNAKTINCNESGYYSIFNSDRYGFNNPDYEWDKEEIEFFLIGDSFALGSCVNRPHDFASVLRNLSNKSAITVGIGSNGPLTEKASLDEYSSKKIKNIIWFYYEFNDIFDLDAELKSNILIKYLEDINFSQNLINRQTEIDLFYDLVIQDAVKKYNDGLLIKDDSNFFSIYKFLKFIKLYKTRSLLNEIIFNRYETTFTTEENFLIFEKISKEIKDKSIQLNANLYFVYLPSLVRYSNNKFLNVLENERKTIKQIIKKQNINFIDIKEFFQEIKNPKKYFPFETEMHYTQEGFKKISEKIYLFIKNN